MNSCALKALWLALGIVVAGAVVMSFQIEAPRLTEEQIEQWR